MTDREALLACYLSGQMSAAQWERHCEDDPELRTLVSGDSPSDLPPSLAVKPNLDWSEQTIEQLEAERVYWDERVRTAPGFASANAAVEFRDACDIWINQKRAKGGDANAPALSRADDASPGVKTGATDPIAAMRGALEPFAKAAGKFDDVPGVYRCADDVQIARHSNWIGYLEVGDLRRARAALAAYDAAGRAVKFGDDEMDEDGIRSMAEYRAAVGEPLLRRHATWQPEDDCRDKTVPEMVAHIYKNRKGLAVAPNGHTTPFLTVEEWSRIADFLNDYDFQPRQMSLGQSAGVEAMARELALKFRRPFSSEKLIEELLSFAARVAADEARKALEWRSPETAPAWTTVLIACQSQDLQFATVARRNEDTGVWEDDEGDEYSNVIGWKPIVMPNGITHGGSPARVALGKRGEGW